MREKLLLVEDDDEIADVLRLHLVGAGYSVEREADGLAAIAAVDRGGWDLVLLDLMLPGVDGWEVCRRVRNAHPELPVIILSARSAEAHRILGLELGADDYLVKPFSMLELVARIRALFRRIDQTRSPVTSADVRLVVFGDFRLDPRRRELSRLGEAVPLTLREFDLLSLLAGQPGRAFSRRELLTEVWGEGFDGYEHTVNSHINRLRAKIEIEPGDPKMIVTVWGLGYRFEGSRAA